MADRWHPRAVPGLVISGESVLKSGGSARRPTDYSPGLGKMICLRNEWLSNSAPLASAGGVFLCKD